MIKKHEGLRLVSYLCPAGVWTIGYGHTLTAREDQTITQEQAVKLLVKDLRHAEGVVNNYNLDINQNQFDALVSFVFNIGSGNFARSTLLRKAIKNAQDATIADEFRRWNKAGGRPLPGLTKRREEEAQLYFEK
jgi:lysozyme